MSICSSRSIFFKNTTKRTAMKFSFSWYPMLTCYFQFWVQDFKVKPYPLMQIYMFFFFSFFLFFFFSFFFFLFSFSFFILFLSFSVLSSPLFFLWTISSSLFISFALNLTTPNPQIKLGERRKFVLSGSRLFFHFLFPFSFFLFPFSFFLFPFSLIPLERFRAKREQRNNSIILSFIFVHWSHSGIRKTRILKQICFDTNKMRSVRN